MIRKHLSPTLLLAAALLPGQLAAHGSMLVPESRVYNCFLSGPENPNNPACAAAKDVAGPQAFYDWNGVNQAAAHGNHQAVVPDGQLCGGGNPTFAGLNLARPDWEATPIAPKADGTFDFVFWATAPHATQDWIFYSTHQGYTGNDPLKWGDLFEFCRLGNVPLSGQNYVLNCPLPPVTGKHVIYTVWQRSDSGEAFYTCTDVVLGDGPVSPWADRGPFTAQSSLTAGSTVTLRLFNSGGGDVESVTHTVATGATQPAEWAYAFAQTVNAQSQYARIGVLDTQSGNINPLQSASGNRVYTQASENLTHEIDIQVSGGGSSSGGSSSSSSGGSSSSSGGSSSGGGGSYDYAYPDGIGSYVAGQTIVLGTDGNRYQCRPFPEGGWCNVNSASHYGPGTGSHWQDAWIPL